MTDTDCPNGPISELVYEYDCQLQAARKHATAEGHLTDARTILNSYDRTLHPWMHGRRPADLAERLREWWPLNSRGDSSDE